MRILTLSLVLLLVVSTSRKYEKQKDGTLFTHLGYPKSIFEPSRTFYWKYIHLKKHYSDSFSEPRSIKMFNAKITSLRKNQIIADADSIQICNKTIAMKC